MPGGKWAQRTRHLGKGNLMETGANTAWQRRMMSRVIPRTSRLTPSTVTFAFSPNEHSKANQSKPKDVQRGREKSSTLSREWTAPQEGRWTVDSGQRPLEGQRVAIHWSACRRCSGRQVAQPEVRLSTRRASESRRHFGIGASAALVQGSRGPER